MRPRNVRFMVSNFKRATAQRWDFQYALPLFATILGLDLADERGKLATHLVGSQGRHSPGIAHRVERHALAGGDAQALELILVGLGDIVGAPALAGQQEHKAVRALHGNARDAVKIARHHDRATEIVHLRIIGDLHGLRAIEDAEELLIRAVDRLILFGQGQDRGEIVVHERGGGGAQHAIDAGSLLLDKGDHLRRKLDVVVDLALGGACDATNLVAHALEVEIDVNDRLEQAEVGRDRALCGNEVVAHGLEVRAAGVDRQRRLLGAAGQLLIVDHKGVDGIVQGEVDGLEDGQHLVARLDELAGEEESCYLVH